MNNKQGTAVVAALVALGFIYMYRPYHFDAGLIGGTGYVYFQDTPPDEQTSFNGWLLRWELAFVLFSLLAALLALSRSASRRLRRVWTVILTLQSLFFVAMLPSFNGILVPELTWYLLTTSALFLLCGAAIAWCRQGDRHYL
jgi:hypothetical protein